MQRRSRRGRPPSFEGAIGPVDFHVGLRFDRLRREQLRMLVDLARDAGDDAATPSSLVSRWIRERLDNECRKRGLVIRARNAAFRSLKERRRTPHLR